MSESVPSDSFVEPFELPWNDEKIENILYLSSPSSDSDAPDVSWSSGAGALCHRSQELAILNNIYSKRRYASDKRDPDDSGMTPLKDIFEHKIVNNLDNINDKYFAKVINPSYKLVDQRIKSFVIKDKETEREQMAIKAAQKAIITRRLLDDWDDKPPLIILSGGEGEGQYFINALKSIWETNQIPKVCHCIRGDSYYPGHLLTALISYHQYHLKNDGRKGELRRGPLDENQVSTSLWEEAVKGASKPHNYDYHPVKLNSMKGNNVADRLYCWKEGIVCSDSTHSFSVDSNDHRESLEELKRICIQQGHSDLASFIKFKIKRYL